MAAVNPVKLPLFHSQMAHELAWDRNRV